MKIGILGTRGIPNNYGGYEGIAEYLSVGLVNKGHDVTVYNSHNHPNQDKIWNGVHIQHCYDPEYFLNTAGQFVYDLNCIRHASKMKFDVILFMGYTSSSVWYPFFPKSAVVISNMDGLEWKRQKYSAPVRKFLKYAERLAVKHSNFHIADSTAIKTYLDSAYRMNTQYIPYGAENTAAFISDKNGLNAEKQNYHMIIARMEPENNQEMILDGFHASNARENMLVIGKCENAFGKYLKKKYHNDARIIFKGSLFDREILRELRKNATIYFHGHSVGGTNPSLLEAMADGVLIAAHKNEFNRAILEEDAFYFSNSEEVTALLNRDLPAGLTAQFKEKNFVKTRIIYTQESVIEQYHAFITKSYAEAKR